MGTLRISLALLIAAVAAIESQAQIHTTQSRMRQARRTAHSPPIVIQPQRQTPNVQRRDYDDYHKRDNYYRPNYYSGGYYYGDRDYYGKNYYRGDHRHYRTPHAVAPIIIPGFYVTGIGYDYDAARRACQERLKQTQENIRRNLEQYGTPEERYAREAAEHRASWTGGGETEYLRSIGVDPRLDRDEMRTWQSRDGTFEEVAQYLGIEYGEVILVTETGRKFQVHVRNLSDSDLLWITQNKVSAAHLSKYLD